MSPSDPDGNSSSTKEPSDRGLVAGIVIGVVSLGLLLLALVAVLCYRHYLHRNVTSMNFDNPVYRKTTEDQFSLEKNRFPLPSAGVGEEVRTNSTINLNISIKLEKKNYLRSLKPLKIVNMPV